MTQTYYPTEQRTIEQEQTLHSLLAWCYINQTQLPALFYSYSRNQHYQKHQVYNYEKPHRLYGHVTTNRLEAATLLLLEGGVGCIWLEDGNDWRPGKRVWVMGLESSMYETSFSFEDDIAGAKWAGDCACDDHEPHRPCKHKTAAILLAMAYQGLKK